MIDLIALLGLLAFSAASLLVGARLLGLARHTRGLPERLLGLSLMLAGGIGTMVGIAPAFLPGLDPRVAYATYQLSSILCHVGYALLPYFVLRVFRPRTTWAMGLFLLSLAFLAIGAVGLAVTLPLGQSIHHPGDEGRIWQLASLMGRFIGNAWAGIESLGYYVLLRRRLALGFVDRETTNRFFYWGVCTIAGSVVWLNMATEMLIPAVAANVAAARMVSALLGIVSTCSLSVAFFPGARRSEETLGAEAPKGTSHRG
ncbi:MAG TPA: hypothetical protein PLW10_11095 [Myxococcota bacterium]|nr:hypothetical protein [Myxococcota bacterium]